MTGIRTADGVRIADVLGQYGRCLELIPLDPHFHDISVGLYENGGTMTAWTFSRKPGVEARIEKIRDQLVALGGLQPVAGSTNQVRFPCGQLHRRPLMFLMMQAVEKDPDFAPPEGRVTVKDRRSDLMLSYEVEEAEGRWLYRVTAEGEAPNAAQRLRAVSAGFVKYGEMEKVEGGVAFPCGQRHNELMALVLPYARNITAVDDMLEASALRGQMTTGTLGFTPPT